MTTYTIPCALTFTAPSHNAAARLTDGAMQHLRETFSDDGTLIDAETEPPAPFQVVAVGSPFDGIALYGPFATAEDAQSWGERQQMGEWWLPDVHAPSGVERPGLVQTISTPPTAAPSAEVWILIWGGGDEPESPGVYPHATKAGALAKARELMVETFGDGADTDLIVRELDAEGYSASLPATDTFMSLRSETLGA